MRKKEKKPDAASINDSGNRQEEECDSGRIALMDGDDAVLETESDVDSLDDFDGLDSEEGNAD